MTSEQWSGAIPGGASRTVSHVYNREFQPSSQTVAGGAAVAFGYDDDGLLTSAGSLAIRRLSSNGLPDSSHVGVIVRSADYDAAGELQNLRYRETGSGQVLFQQSLKRDALGRIEEIGEYSFGTSRTLRYRYDGAGRLYAVKVGNDTVARYFYDANGNRVNWDNGGLSPADTATALYDDQDRLLRYRDTAYEWTAAGELRRKIETPSGETTEYWYDALGSLNKVEFDNGDTVTYAADGANRRVGRRLNGSWSGGWRYQDGLRVIAELDASGAVLNRFVYGEEAHVPALLVRGGDTYRLVTDHLGSVRGVVKTSDGTVTQRREYDAWGVATTDSNAAFQALGYAGGPTDPTTGLVRFGARDYQPGVGRWTAKDPSGLGRAGANLFAYAHSAPTTFVDVDGLVPSKPGFKYDPVSNPFQELERLRRYVLEKSRKFNRPGINPRHVNKWVHAEVSRLGACRYGRNITMLANTIKEYQDTIVDGQTWEEMLYDLQSEWEGVDGDVPQLPIVPVRYVPEDR